MTRFVLLAALALAARPAAAQTADDFADATPERVLAATWAEALYGAEAVARALDDVAADTAGAAPEAPGEAARGRALAAVAAVAAASTAGMLGPTLQFSLALADPAERPSVYAAIGEDAAGLYTLMLLVAEAVNPPPDDPTVRSAAVQNPDGSADGGAPAAPEDWTARAEQIRAAVGRLRGATAALGISAP